MRSNQDHERGIEQVQVILSYRHKQKHGERQAEGDLHAQIFEWILLGGRCRTAGQFEHELRRGEDEKSAKDRRENGGAWTDPAYESGRCQPEHGGDKLPPKASDEDRAHLSLSV